MSEVPTSFEDIVLFRGPRLTIACAVGPSGKMPIEGFLSDARHDDEIEAFRQIWEMHATHGVRNERKLKKLKSSNNVWEMKTGEWRLFFFAHRTFCFLTHAVKKAKIKSYQRHFDRVYAIRRAHMQWMTEYGRKA
jgi:hypothetical protein